MPRAIRCTSTDFACPSSTHSLDDELIQFHFLHAYGACQVLDLFVGDEELPVVFASHCDLPSRGGLSFLIFDVSPWDSLS